MKPSVAVQLTQKAGKKKPTQYPTIVLSISLTQLNFQQL